MSEMSGVETECGGNNLPPERLLPFSDKKHIVPYEKIIFISDLLQKQEEIRNILDTRTNIVIGINSALIVFIISNFRENFLPNVVYVMALGVAVLSLFFSITALKPPRFLTKKGQEESLFYHHHICSKSLENYKQEVNNALNDTDRIFDAYIVETYNLTKFSNIPRKYYLYLSIKILIYGILLVVSVYIASLIIGLIHNF